MGIHAPGKDDNPGVDPYQCAHNILKSHAKAYHTYNNTYRSTQNGMLYTYNLFAIVLVESYLFSERQLAVVGYIFINQLRVCNIRLSEMKSSNVPVLFTTEIFVSYLLKQLREQSLYG